MAFVIPLSMADVEYEITGGACESRRRSFGLAAADLCTSGIPRSELEGRASSPGRLRQPNSGRPASPVKAQQGPRSLRALLAPSEGFMGSTTIDEASKPSDRLGLVAIGAGQLRADRRQETRDWILTAAFCEI